MEQHASSYPFGDAWKASVDRSGTEWIRYCEAVSAVKRYLRTRRDQGKEAAVDEFESFCQVFREKAGPAREQSLRDSFCLIWRHERHALAEVVGRELAPQSGG